MTVCLFPGDILSFPWLSVSFLSNILSFYWLPVSFLCLTVCLSAWMCFSTWLSASFLSACFISRLPFLASSLALFSHTDFLFIWHCQQFYLCQTSVSGHYRSQLESVFVSEDPAASDLLNEQRISVFLCARNAVI
jgi:hypothetical protein